MSGTTVEDIARLRAIAEEGRAKPLLGGRQMILWGSLVIVALLAQWAITTRMLPLPMMAIAAVWFGVMGLGAIVGRLAAFYPGEADMPQDIANRIERAVWQMGGAFLGVVAVSIFAVALYHVQMAGSSGRFILFALMPPISFGVYAIALRTTAEAAAMPALKPYAGLSLVMVAVTTLLAGTIWQFPVSAAGIFLVAILPGRMMLAKARQVAHG